MYISNIKIEILSFYSNNDFMMLLYSEKEMTRTEYNVNATLNSCHTEAKQL